MADYLEGDLELDKRALFDAHIDECAECASEISEMRGTISLLHMLPEPRVPANMSREVMRRIQAGDTQSVWNEKLQAIFGLLLEPRVLAPISAAVLVLGLVIGTNPLRLQYTEAPLQAGSTAAQASVAGVAPVRPGAEATNEPPVIVLSERDSAGPRTRLVRLTPKQEMIALSRLLASTSPLSQIRFQVWPSPPLAAAPRYRNSPPTSEFQTVSAQPEGLRSLGASGAPATSIALNRSGQPSVDEWLARLQDDPGSFAGKLVTTSLAEQELWINHLAK